MRGPEWQEYATKRMTGWFCGPRSMPANCRCSVEPRTPPSMTEEEVLDSMELQMMGIKP